MSTLIKPEINNISKEGILNLLNLPVTNKYTNATFTLQVHHLNKNESNNQSIQYYKCILSDQIFRYCGFIIKYDNESQINVGDLIKFNSVIVSSINKGANKIFLIKKYEIVQKNTKLIKDLPLATNEILKQHSLKKTDENVNENNNNSNNSKSNNKTFNDDSLLMELEDVYDEVINGENEQKDSNKNTLSNNVEENIIEPSEVPKFLKLSELNTNSKDITLYVKVIKKCEIKKFFNKVTKQNCHLLSFDLCDSDGNEMQATIFDKCCDKFVKVLQEGEVYLIKGGYVKVNDKKYTNIKADFKLIFDMNTTIKKVNKKNDTYFVDKKNKNYFTKIIDFPQLEINSIIDCLVTVLDVFPINKKVTQKGEVIYRRITIGDISKKKCDLTLWKKFAEIEIQKENILLLKYIRVSEYNNILLTTTVDDSEIIVNPLYDSEKEVKELRKIVQENSSKNIWTNIQNTNKTNNKDLNINYVNFNNDKLININNSIINDNSDFIPISYMKTILGKISENVKESVLSKVKGTILEIVHSTKNFYGGCPEKSCRKKLILRTNNNNDANNNEEEWYCQTCKKTFPQPFYYYTLNLRIKDASIEYFVDFYGETVTKLFGIKANEYKKLLDNNDENILGQITQKLEFKTFIFIGKANVQIYNNKLKKKFFAYKYEPVNYNSETKRLINNIKNILNIKN